MSLDKKGGVAFKADNTKVKLDNLNIIKPITVKIDSLLISRRDKRKFSYTRATAMYDCLKGHPESGLTIIENLLNNVKRYKKLKNKLNYTLSTIIIVLFNIIIASLINTIWKNNLDSQIIFLFTVATFGSMGGLISVLTKVPKLDLDIEGSSFLQRVDGFSRIFLSMISSIIVYVLIKSNIVLGSFNEIALTNQNIMYAFSIAAGFSEKFIPNIIMSIENNKTNDQSDINLSKK